MRIAGYGDTPECRRLMAESHGDAVMPGEQQRLHVVRARERLPGGRALWGTPSFRSAAPASLVRATRSRTPAGIAPCWPPCRRSRPASWTGSAAPERSTLERVALRTLFSHLAASRAQVKAALLHNAFTDRGGGAVMLSSLGIGPEAMAIIRITTLPPAADYYRDFERIGPDECERYLAYISGLAASRERAAIEMKLAGITDTIDACRARATPVLIGQLHNRYKPSRRILEEALTSMV